MLFLLHKQFLNNIPEFYKNVLTSWMKTVGGQLSSPLTFSNVRKQILWGNRFITFYKKCFDQLDENSRGSIKFTINIQ